MLVARQAGQAPDLPAIAQGGTVWTYAQLAARCRDLAGQFRGAGIQAGERVAVTGPRTFELVAAMLAAWMAGAVLVPIDPSLPEHRQRVMTDEAGARWLVRTDWAGHAVESLPIAAGAGPGGGLPGGATVSSVAADAAYVVFTSGTTSTPNAVLGSHRGLSHFLEWQRVTFGVGPGDRCAQLTGLSFDVALRDIFLPLVAGAVLCLPDSGGHPPPGEVCHWLARDRISLLHAVPTVAEAWLLGMARPPGGPLRGVFFAGEPLPAALVDRWRAVWPATRQVVNLYGPTETTLAACFHVVEDAPGPGVQPLGRSLPHIRALVVADDGRVCPPGEPGEIRIGSPFRSHGYLNDPAGNEHRFVPGPPGEDPSVLFFRTGDVGVRGPGGILEYHGRLDEQVKILGVRVRPEEVAAVLATHPAVAASRVVPGRDRHGGTVLDAFYQPAPGTAPVQAAGLRGYLADRLPAAMLPASMTPVTGFPVTPNGKLDRATLRLVAPAPADLPATEGGPLLGPLAEIWAEVLEIPPPGPADDFFDLGGHSLLAARMLSRIRAEFGVEVPLRVLLMHPALGELAGVVSSLSRPGRSRTGGSRPSGIPRLARPGREAPGPGGGDRPGTGGTGIPRPGQGEP